VQECRISDALVHITASVIRLRRPALFRRDSVALLLLADSANDFAYIRLFFNDVL